MRDVTSQNRPGTAARAVFLALLFVSLAVVMAFPRIDRLASATAGDYADGYLARWVMAWDIHALLEDPDILEANIFWPATDALTYAESLLPPALAVGALSVIDEEAATNVVYLATWVLSLAGMYLLSMWFVGNRPAALLAAIVFTFAAPRLSSYFHFQAIFACLFPVCLYLFFRFKEERMMWQASLLGLSAAVTSLSSLYFGVSLVIAFLFLFLWIVAFDRRALSMRFLAGIALAGVLFALITGPIAFAYLRSQQDSHLQRGSVEKDLYSAVPKDLITFARHSYLYSKLVGPRTDTRPIQLFPGAAAVALSAVGAAVLMRRSRAPSPPTDLGRKGIPVAKADVRTPFALDHRKDLVALCLLGLLFFILSFGRSLVLGGATIPLPYDAIDELPGLASLRGVSRFFLVAMVSIAGLVAVGFAWISAKLASRWAMAGAALVGMFMLAEYALPINTVPEISNHASLAVNRELNRRPHGNVLELPMVHPREVWWGYTEAPRMYLSRFDWKPRINGYSGFAPPGYAEKAEVFPALEAGGADLPKALQLLKDNKVRYIVIRTAPTTPPVLGAAPPIPGVTFYDEAAAARIVAAIPPEMMAGTGRFGNAVLIELRT